MSVKHIEWSRIVALIIIGTGLLLSSCVSGYRMMRPESISLHPDSAQGTDSVQILWRGNILSASGNSKYARMEKKNGVSLLLLRIDNQRQRTLVFGEDVVFTHADGEPIPLLTMQEALEALVEPVTDEEPAVEVDAAVWKLGGFVNDMKTVKSHVDFVNEMTTYYLEDTLVRPQSALLGMVALPVVCGTPFTIDVK